MHLPAGTYSGTLENPDRDALADRLRNFSGFVGIEGGSDHGLLLLQKGILLAAYYREDDFDFRGEEALRRMDPWSATIAHPKRSFTLKSYSVDELAEAIGTARLEKFLLPDAVPGVCMITGRGTAHELIDEKILRRLAGQPGVIAISVVFEGFSIQSVGSADFEHVAALAEDLIRAGTRIAGEMKIGLPDQVILETAGNKLIVAACGNLTLCVFTAADAPLGLIRILVKNIQAGPAC